MGKRRLIQRLVLKIGVAFTLYISMLQNILDYRTFNITFYIES
jgi:hypothetical protein